MGRKKPEIDNRIKLRRPLPAEHHEKLVGVRQTLVWSREKHEMLPHWKTEAKSLCSLVRQVKELRSHFSDYQWFLDASFVF